MLHFCRNVNIPGLPQNHDLLKIVPICPISSNFGYSVVFFIFFALSFPFFPYIRGHHKLREERLQRFVKKNRHTYQRDF